jgi:hypothetical protein
MTSVTMSHQCCLASARIAGRVQNRPRSGAHEQLNGPGLTAVDEVLRIALRALVPPRSSIARGEIVEHEPSGRWAELVTLPTRMASPVPS